MSFTVEEISKFINGEIKGDASRTIDGVNGLLIAGKSDASFIKDIRKASFLEEAKKTAAGVIIIPKGFELENKTTIGVENPLRAFSIVLEKFKSAHTRFDVGVHPSSFVSSKAKIGKNCIIGPLCVVEDDVIIGDNVVLISHVYVGPGCSIGEGSKLYAHVTLRENTLVGKKVVIDANSVIGSDGFGYFPNGNVINKIPQIGNVILEDNVELGAGVVIDRATMGSTIIKQGSKFDNLVHIAHNVTIGENTLLAAQVGIAGSAKIGRGVVMGGQVGIADHAEIGDGTQIGAQSGVKGKIKSGSILFGSPAQPLLDELKQVTLLKKLPEAIKILKKLKEKCGLE